MMEHGKVVFFFIPGPLSYQAWFVSRRSSILCRQFSILGNRLRLRCNKAGESLFSFLFSLRGLAHCGNIFQNTISPSDSPTHFKPAIAPHNEISVNGSPGNTGHAASRPKGKKSILDNRLGSASPVFEGSDCAKLFGNIAQDNENLKFLQAIPIWEHGNFKKEETEKRMESFGRFQAKKRSRPS
jgi:hypothetical protein